MFGVCCRVALWFVVWCVGFGCCLWQMGACSGAFWFRVLTVSSFVVCGLGCLLPGGVFNSVVDAVL